MEIEVPPVLEGFELEILRKLFFLMGLAMKASIALRMVRKCDYGLLICELKNSGSPNFLDLPY